MLLFELKSFSFQGNSSNQKSYQEQHKTTRTSTLWTLLWKKKKKCLCTITLKSWISEMRFHNLQFAHHLVLMSSNLIFATNNNSNKRKKIKLCKKISTSKDHIILKPNFNSSKAWSHQTKSTFKIFKYKACPASAPYSGQAPKRKARSNLIKRSKA